MLDVLGVDPGSPQWRMTGGDTLQGALDVMINEVLAERALARKEKNWARADQLRDRLAAAGIQVERATGVPPTLDDVFLALTGRTLRDADAADAG